MCVSLLLSSGVLVVVEKFGMFFSDYLVSFSSSLLKVVI